MNIQPNRFKAALTQGTPIAGSWIMTGSANAAEAMAWSGIGFIIVDMEHTDATLPDVVAMLRAVAESGTEVIVRPPSLDPILIRRLLDAGARSLMIPFVETAEQAESIVAACRFPPKGNRGFALMHRGSRYAQTTDYLNTVEDNICIVAQIETREGIDNTDQIAQVDGIDALFYGPGDLSSVAGAIGNTTGDAVRDLIRQEAARCRALGIASGTLVPDLTSIDWARDVGFDFISVTNDYGMIMKMSKDIVARIQQPEASAAKLVSSS